MSTMELEARKAGFIRDVLLNVDNIELLDKLSDCLKRNLNPALEVPCCYSVEEVKERLATTSADAIAGRGISEEEAERMMEEMA